MKTTSNTSKQMHTTYKRLFVLLFMSFGFFSWGQIVSNGDFESWTGSSPDGWTTIDSGITTAQESSIIHGGNYSANINVTTDSQSETDLRQTVSLTNSHNYHVSVWVRHTEGHVKARLYIGDYQGYFDKTITGSWQELTYDFTANSTSIEIGLRFYDQSGFDGNEIVYVDDFIITDQSGPTITVNPTSLTGFTYVEGNGPSAEQSFTVEGSNLTNDITVTPPANWEISTSSGGTYQSNALTLTQNGGTVNSMTIYTRMVAGLTNANSPFLGNIACASSGATTVNVAVDGTVDAAVPEIQITGNAIEILDGDTTPSTSDDTDFGNVEVAGANSVTHTFTINNTGGADLTINSISSNNADFAVSGTTSGTIAAGGSSTFTVTFDPSALGTRTATITVDNDDADEGTYTFTVQGTGTNSNQSDIVAHAGFNYTTNINYKLYQEAGDFTNTSSNIGVFKFDIRDGGGNSDNDNVGTTLTAITFSVGNTHAAYIRNAALFDGNLMLANHPTIDNTAGTISFSGLSGTDFIAPDDGTKAITLRVSFTTQVEDNEQLQFTVTSATADNSGSIFAATDAGGAQSETSGDKNRIEVTADRIRFSVQPQSQSKDTYLNPFEIQAQDENGILDKDAGNQIDLTTSGTGMTSSSPYTLSNGKISISDVKFSDAQTGITLTATTTGLAYDNDDTSAPFNIYDVADGSYRTTSDGTWKSTSGGTAGWEQFSGGSWTTISDQPPANTDKPVYILHDITLVGTNSASDITIENGGTLSTAGVSQTLTKLLVKNGGTYNKQANGVKVNEDGVIEVEDGGTFTFKHTNGTSLSTNLWNGKEKFHSGSNFIIVETDNTADFQFMESKDDVSSFNGGQFGNIIIDVSQGKLLLLPDQYNDTLTKGNLIIKNLADNIKFTKDNATCVIKGNLEIQSTVNNDITITTKEKNVTLTVEGDFIHNGTEDFRLANSNSINPNVMLNIYGDLILSGTASKFRPDISSNGTGTNEINLQGDLSVNENSILYSENNNSVLNFTGTGDGLTSATTQTVDIATTDDSNENKNIQFNVTSGAYVQLVNHNLELGKDGKLTVKAGGIFDFGFNGTTPLIVTKSGAQTGTAFKLEQGGYLKITSPDGIMSNSSAGNVQVVASNTQFSPLANFHYIGKTDQVTGDAIGSSSNGRAIIVELDGNSLSLTPSQSFGFTNATNTNINYNNGGILDIRKGKFVETTSEYITGSTGALKMASGTAYVIPHNADSSSDYIPRMNGTYNLTAGSTIELNGDGDQILRGQRAYKDLTFANAGTKTISSAISTVSEIYITDDAIVDVENHTFGGSGTDFYMDTNAIYKTAGTGTKPDAQGGYMLDGASKIIFTNTVSTMEIIRLSPEYKNIVIEGNNVGTNSEISGIQIQSGGTFTVKSGASFKLKNTAGFNGGTSTAIDNTNSPTITLESGSNIEYYGDNQSITEPDNGYQNLIISGTGDKTLATNEVVVNEDLTVSSSRLLLEDGKGIKVLGNVSNDGTIEVNNQGAFVQTVDNASISGNNTNTKFILNKTSLPLNNYWEYVYWSSPINSSTFTLGDIVSNAWRYYEFDPNEANNGHTYPGWVMLSATDIPQAGVGYAVSAPAGAGANTVLNVQFKKDHDPFNNGEIQVPILKKGGPDNVGDYNLIGNPYPSAIDFDALYNDNTAAINGSYYLWTNCAGLDANGHHQDSGYTTYTYSNGNGTSAVACNDGNGNGYSHVAGRYIATGQGFIVEAAADNQTLTFKNAHRVTGHNDNFLNRSNNPDRDIVWLDMTNDTGKFSQIAVGFYPGATANYDAMFDAHSLNAASGFSLYSLAGTDKLVIQGLSPDNIERTIVPLGVEVSSGENITLQINRLERFDAYDIYLVDNLSGTYHNLKVSPYTLSLVAGVYEERFVLTFARVLNTDEQTATFSLILSQHNGLFRLWHSGDENIQKIAVYNLSGQLIYENNSVNKSEVEIDLHNIATGNLLVFKVIDDKGRTAVKKAVKK